MFKVRSSVARICYYVYERYIFIVQGLPLNKSLISLLPSLLLKYSRLLFTIIKKKTISNAIFMFRIIYSFAARKSYYSIIQREQFHIQKYYFFFRFSHQSTKFFFQSYPKHKKHLSNLSF